MQDQKEEMTSEFHAIAIILFSLLLYSCMFDFYLAKTMSTFYGLWQAQCALTGEFGFFFFFF
jgi:hypothetical protein